MAESQPAKKKSKVRKVYRITIVCRKTENKLVTIEGVNKPSFKCPLCKKTLIYLPAEHRITSHGAPKPGTDPKAPPPDHDLRKVAEVSQVKG